MHSVMDGLKSSEIHSVTDGRKQQRFSLNKAKVALQHSMALMPDTVRQHNILIASLPHCLLDDDMLHWQNATVRHAKHQTAAQEHADEIRMVKYKGNAWKPLACEPETPQKRWQYRGKQG